MIRIDSLTYFNAGLAGMQNNQSAIARLNQQIASGERLLAPKDDPIATTKVMELSNRVAMRTQFVANQDRAELTLKYENTVVQEVNAALNRARGLISGINAGHDPALRNSHAEQLKGVFNQLLDLANTRDPAGNYIFGGFNTGAQPFANAGDGGTVLVVGPPPVYEGADTTYAGTPLTPAPGGVRSIEVDVGRLIQVNDNLDSVFQANSGANSDLLKDLDAVIFNLPGAITQTQIDDFVAQLDSTLSRLDRIEHRIAGALTELGDVRQTTQSLLLQERNALGELRQVDQAAAIVELQTRQTALEAAGRAYARTANLSLFSFL